MLSLFRTNQLLASVLLIPYALLLHVGYWLVPLTEAAPIHGIGSFYLQQWLGQHPVWMPTVVIGLLFIQGVLANLFMFDHRLGPDINLFTGVFVVFLGSLIPLFLPFAGYHVANIFLLLALLALMQVYKVNHAADHIFNTGLWLGIASMFQVQYLVFLLAALVGLTLLRKSSLREQLILTLGAFTPWLLVGFGVF